MAVNNQGIVHWRIHGMLLACRSVRAHMAVGRDRFDAEPRKCKRCEKRWEDAKAREAARQRGISNAA